ncbi:MAG: hypothetical protein M3Y56_07155 [Armatimonadota bacterium]|nr:hypothetical protein [Armatimonadota bacterium]
MYKLPQVPSPQAENHELADFAELTCWHYGLVSKQEILAYLDQVDDNDNNIGCDDDEDKNSELLDEVMNEIERRNSDCGRGYPFELDSTGTILRHQSKNLAHRATLYRYLLLSTRLNMKENRVHIGIDGAALLEEVAAHALKNYLGGNRARSHVFGTASAGGFQDKVNRLCSELGEGGRFRSLDNAPVQAQDDKLDAVAWVPFSDSLPGQIIIFGQCKTGTNWSGLVTQLQPDAFIKKWMTDPILVNPVRAFCISEAVGRSRWKGLGTEAGIMLDRCRLVDFCEDLEPDLFERISEWTSAAKDTIEYSSR